MRKKGFTLVEIIICISLLVVIGVGSFISIRVVSNKIKLDKLEKMQDKIMDAVEVYIEKNKTVKNQLYDNKNGVVIPLNLLQNEGLIDLKGVINEKSDDYVVAVLGDTEPNECQSPYIKGSWQINNDSAPIYICTKSDGSGSNLATIDPTKYSNKTYVSNEPYYFRGMDPDNFIKISGGIYRIYYIDRDDSIIFTNNGSRNTYSNKNLPLYDGVKLLGESDKYDFYKTIASESLTQIPTKTDGYGSEAQNKVSIEWYRYSWLNVDGVYLFKISDAKITGGTGSKDNPFEITKKS